MELSHERGVRFILVTAIVVTVLAAGSRFLTPPVAAQPPVPSHPDGLAVTPPLGWNSYDCYWGDVNEKEVRDNARHMAKHLASHGWKYVVVDYYWYFPHPKPGVSEETEDVEMDAYGRLIPPVNRFPSAANGQGFKPLANYVHSLGLKFGIHIMRGIPRAAVKKNLPILGTSQNAQDVADLANTCAWSTAMYGVNVSKPGGQAYYDSLAKLYAEWGVDFVKADDMSRGEDPKGEAYHGPEIEALRQAMTRTGRPMALSLSPGATQLVHALHVARWSQMWRISDDMWDTWKQLKEQFDLCRNWASYSGPNHWPDADMLPLGRIRIRGYDPKEPPHTRLTHDEQITVMTLWSIFRSPLMMGGDLPSLDLSTQALLTNDEVLAVDQSGSGSHELFRRGDQIAWEAEVPGSKGKYVALFDVGEEAQQLAVTAKELGLRGKVAARDLWQKKDLGTFDGQFTTKLRPHAAGLYKIVPVT